jgi:hypothetical protein
VDGRPSRGPREFLDGGDTNPRKLRDAPAAKVRTTAGLGIRPSAMAGYLTSYYDVDRQKLGERLVTSDEQIAYLFHVVQAFVR